MQSLEKTDLCLGGRRSQSPDQHKKVGGVGEELKSASTLIYPKAITPPHPPPHTHTTPPPSSEIGLNWSIFFFNFSYCVVCWFEEEGRLQDQMEDSDFQVSTRVASRSSETRAEPVMFGFWFL